MSSYIVEPKVSPFTEQPRNQKPPRRNKLWRRRIFIAVLCAATLWTLTYGLWRVRADMAIEQIETWLQAMALPRDQLTLASPTIHGFPTKMVLRWPESELSGKHGTANFSFKWDQLLVRVPLVQHHVISAQVLGLSVHMKWPDGQPSSVVKAPAARMTIHQRDDDRWDMSLQADAVSSQGLTWLPDWQNGQLQVQLVRLDQSRATGAFADMVVSLQAQIDDTTPLRFETMMTVFGSMRPASWAMMLKSWQQQRGYVDVQRLLIELGRHTLVVNEPFTLQLTEQLRPMMQTNIALNTGMEGLLAAHEYLFARGDARVTRRAEWYESLKERFKQRTAMGVVVTQDHVWIQQLPILPVPSFDRLKPIAKP